jgi:hypothetical protein
MSACSPDGPRRRSPQRHLRSWTRGGLPLNLRLAGRLAGRTLGSCVTDRAPVSPDGASPPGPIWERRHSLAKTSGRSETKCRERNRSLLNRNRPQDRRLRLRFKDSACSNVCHSRKWARWPGALVVGTASDPPPCLRSERRLIALGGGVPRLSGLATQPVTGSIELREPLTELGPQNRQAGEGQTNHPARLAALQPQRTRRPRNRCLMVGAEGAGSPGVGAARLYPAVANFSPEVVRKKVTR